VCIFREGEYKVHIKGTYTHTHNLHTINDIVPEAEQAGGEDRVQDKEEERKDGHGVVAALLHIRGTVLSQAHKDGKEKELHLRVHDGSTQEDTGGDGGFELLLECVCVCM
jgi:hypothetical protein